MSSWKTYGRERFLLCKSKFPFLLEWGRRFFVISCDENTRGKDFLFSFPMAAWPLLNESVALYIPVCRLPGTELRSSYIERCEALLAIPHALMGLESGQRIGNRFLWTGWPIDFGDNRQRNDGKYSCCPNQVQTSLESSGLTSLECLCLCWDSKNVLQATCSRNGAQGSKGSDIGWVWAIHILWEVIEQLSNLLKKCSTVPNLAMCWQCLYTFSSVLCSVLMMLIKSRAVISWLRSAYCKS